MAHTTLLLVDQRPRTAALAALAAAVEADPSTGEMPVFFPAPGQELRAAVARAVASGPVLVGWSSTTMGFPATVAALGEVRVQGGGGATGDGATRGDGESGAAAASVLHVAGGPHPTADPAGTLARGFDLVAIGEGEATLVALLRRIAAGDDPRGAGLAWMEEGRLRRGSPSPEVDLDAVRPFPERLRRLGPIEITRGCDHACRFCQTTHLHGGRVRHRSAARIAEAAGQVRARGGRDVRFVTPSALSWGSEDGAPHVEALDDMLSRVREAVGSEGRIWFGTFPSEVRPEHVTPEVLGMLRRHVANEELAIGAQSGSDAVLDACHRGHGAEDVQRAVALAAAAGFRAKVDLIFGLPGETPEDAAASRALAVELAGMGASIHAHAFLPLPGTPWASAPPGRIDPATRDLLDRLAGKGSLTGPWRRQERAGKG